MEKSQKQIRYLVIAVIAVIVLIVLIIAAGRAGKNSAAASAAADAVQPEDIEAGKAYLQGLEDQSYTTVVDELKQIHTQELKEQRDARMAELEADADSVWSLFQDYVIMGDSRAVGFSYYGFLPEERVIADGGATIRDLQTNIPEIVKLNPSYVFCAYGLNDSGIGYWDTPEDYAAEYKEIVETIQSEIPGVKVFIISTIPATDPAFERNSAWYDIPEFNEAVQAMCDTVDDLYFVDCTELVEESEDFYQEDGIHLRKWFYSPWAVQFIMGEYDAEIADSEDGSTAAAYTDTTEDTADTEDTAETADTEESEDTTDAEETSETADGTEAAE